MLYLYLHFVVVHVFDNMLALLGIMLRVTLYGINLVNAWYDFIYLKKDRMSSMLTFSNRTSILFVLKKLFLIRVKAPYSMRKCLTVQCEWHCGCSCLIIKECISLIWPMCNWDIVTCFFLDFLNAGLHSHKVSLVKKSLLWMLLFKHCCHFVWRNLLFLNLEFIDCWVSSFIPFTSMWLGMQHIRIFLELNIEFNLFKSLMIWGSSSFLFLCDSKTESKSENMIKLLCLLSEIILGARSIAQVSGVKKELSIGKDFLTVLFKMAVHIVLLPLLEPSVKI